MYYLGYGWDKGIKKEENLTIFLFESGRRGSNPRPSAWKANALSTELLPQLSINKRVGSDGFEPPKAKAS